MRVMIRAGEREWPLDGSPVDGLDEQSVYRIRLEEHRTDAEPEHYRAFAGEVPLPVVYTRISGDRSVVEWEWTPEFFAGDFALAITYQGQRVWPKDEQNGTLTVRTPAYKLTVDDYDTMMGDLSRWTTGWLAPAPGRRLGRAEVQRTDSRLGALEYLIRHWPVIERLVESVLERPRRILERIAVTEPLHAVRMLGAEEWSGTLAVPSVWTEHEGPLPSGLSRLRDRAGGLLPGQVVQSRVRSTLDVPENRLLRAMVGDMQRELAASLDDLARYAVGETPGRRSLVERRATQARAMHRRVSGWLRSTWLTELQPELTEPSVTMVKHPVYGALWRHYLQWKRAVTLADGGDRPLPIERTHQLYEFWCFLVLARELAAVVGSNPDQAVAPALLRSGDGVRLQLQKDVRFEVSLPGVRLTYQRTFRYDGSGLRSMSHEMRPDITVEWLGEDGEPRVLLFDPKYRVGHDGLRDGLGAMHRYRDAIVGPDGRRAVVGAFMLCPASPANGPDQRYLLEEYQARWHMGICVLTPGRGARELVRLLAHYLRSSDLLA